MNQFKKQLGFALPIVILIVVVLIIAGGMGYYFYKTSQELEKIEIYPNASKIEPPLSLEEEIRSGLSPKAKITVYSSDDSSEKIKNWYKSQLTDKGWEKIITEKYGIALWKKDEIGLGVVVIPGEEVSEIKEIEEGQTVLLLIKDEFEVWKKFLGISEEEGALLTKTADDCEKITDSYKKGTCYMYVARKTEDASLCEKITSGEIKDTCYFSVAVEAKDASLCEKIADNPRKDGCFGSVALETKDTGLCEKITSVYWRGECYLKIAREIKDVSLCEKIEDQYDKNRCYREVASAEHNLRFCEKIQDVELRDQCKLEVRDNSISTLGYYDASFCEELQTQSVKDKCYKHLACYRLGNQVFCEKIKDPITRDECYCGYADSFAVMDGTAEVGKIKDQSIRDNCYLRIAKGHEKFLTSEFRRNLCKHIQDKYIKQKCEELFKEP